MASRETIQKCMQGQRRAQGELYREFAPYALTVIRRFGVSKWEEADLLQEIFVEVFAKLGNYDPAKGTFTTWLRQITVFRILDLQRRDSRLRFVELDTIPEPTAAEVDLRTLAPEYLLRRIAALPLGYRTVFNLFAIDGYSHREIGEMLGISTAGSRSQYYRARVLLQKSLKKTLKMTADESC